MATQVQRLFLIHYHEIGLKGKNRSFFEKKLQQNIKYCLKKNKFSFSGTDKISGRICVFLNEDTDEDTAEKIFSLLSKIPGVARVSSGYKCEQNLESMISTGILVMKDAGADKSKFSSFKVSARRNHTSFEYDSMQLNQIVGGALSDAFPDIKVQMKDPALNVHLEVIEGSAYLYGKTISAVGGLPVGSSGKMISMLSSGIDSPVSMWTMARRGARMIGVHFSGAPIVSNESEYLVKEIGEKLSRTNCIQKLYIVRIGKYQKKIALECPEKLRIIMYIRFMYKIAQKVAQIEEAKALVTGESLGQVASQTIDNLFVTDAAVNIPVFRPLIGSDKQEIIDRAIQIDTFDTSSQKAPDCCTLYMPKTPETHAKLEYVLKAEEDFDYNQWIEEALKSAEIIFF